MDLTVRKAGMKDVDEVTALYDAVNEYYDSYNNTGWVKGIYPLREDAINGIEQDGLYVGETDGKIIGTFILSHNPEPAFYEVEWKKDIPYDKVLIIFTFAVLPEYSGKGIGRKLLEEAEKIAAENGAESIRLDVFDKNPAIKLYKKCGFEYIKTVDLGYGKYGLDNFELYEKLIK